VEEQLLTLLAQLRSQADYAQGYGPANLLALLLLQRGDCVIAICRGWFFATCICKVSICRMRIFLEH